MEEEVDISVDFAGLKLANPVFTASGTCGYGDELAEFVRLEMKYIKRWALHLN